VFFTQKDDKESEMEGDDNHGSTGINSNIDSIFTANTIIVWNNFLSWYSTSVIDHDVFNKVVTPR